MDTETKKVKKKIDIFIKRLIRCCDSCNKLIKSSIQRSNGCVGFNGELFIDVYFSSKKLHIATVKYSKLSKSIQKLRNNLTGLINRMETEEIAVINNEYRDVIIVSNSIKEYIINMSKLIDDCIFEVSFMFPIVGHKYLIENDGVVSFPITKEKLIK